METRGEHLDTAGWSYSPAGTQSVARRPPVCRRRPTARSVPSRTAETRRAPLRRHPRVLPTTSPASPASRSHSSASWCPVCPGHPPAHACPAESHDQHKLSISPNVVEQLLFFFSNVSNTLHIQYFLTTQMKQLLPWKKKKQNINAKSHSTGRYGS